MKRRSKLMRRAALIVVALLAFGGGSLFAQGVPVQAVAPDPQPPKGAIVGDVTAKAGIARLDVITAIEGQAVLTLNQVAEAVLRHKPGDTMKLTIARASDNTTSEVTMTLGTNPKNASIAYMGMVLEGVLLIVPERDKTPAQQAPRGI